MIQKNLLSVWISSRPLPGEIFNGDLAIAYDEPDSIFAIVLDGLGHGVDAFRSARLAADKCRTANISDLRAMVHEVHEALRASEMACVAFFGIVRRSENLDDGLCQLTYCIIGDVQGVLVGRHVGMLSQQPGCIGVRIPTPKIENRIMALDDVCLIATDGVSMSKLREFLEIAPIPNASGRQRWIDRALSHAARRHDDATLMLLGICNGR